MLNPKKKTQPPQHQALFQWFFLTTFPISQLELDEEPSCFYLDRTVTALSTLTCACASLNEVSVWTEIDLLTGGELFDRVLAEGKFTEHDAVTFIRSVHQDFKYSCFPLSHPLFSPTSQTRKHPLPFQWSRQHRHLRPWRASPFPTLDPLC